MMISTVKQLIIDAIPDVWDDGKCCSLSWPSTNNERFVAGEARVPHFLMRVPSLIILAKEKVHRIWAVGFTYGPYIVRG